MYYGLKSKSATAREAVSDHIIQGLEGFSGKALGIGKELAHAAMAREPYRDIKLLWPPWRTLSR
jgi:hypothetical protein